jgi:pimeloyl-ACP methyl ester carboxylesterase
MNALLISSLVVFLTTFGLTAVQTPLCQSKIVRSKDASLYTESFGNAKNPCCLLIAGASVHARFWSNDFCNHLADHNFFVIRYDHRDLGLSSAVDYSYTLKELAQDACAILDSYSIKKAHMIGHSMGGFIGQWLALYHKDRVASLISISSRPIAKTSCNDQMPEHEQQLQAQTLKMMFDNPVTMDGFLNIWQYQHGTIPMDSEMALDYTRQIFNRSLHKPGAAVQNHQKVIMHMLQTLDQRAGMLKTISTPTLVIHGDQDNLLFCDTHGLATAQEIPGAQCIKVAGMGHMMFNKQLQEQIAHHCISFINENKKD